MFYVFVWCNGSEEQMRNTVPIDFLGELLIKQGYENNINLVFLHGLSHLSPSYLNYLNSLGFNIINKEEEFKKVISRFPNISNRYAIYGRNCFLRWLILKDFIKNNGQIYHIDSDIFFTVSLKQLSKDTEGKTFVLQGCPAFTSISDFKWFEMYEEELEKFEMDIEGYSKTAYGKKLTANYKDSNLCNVLDYGSQFIHDQDLIEYLISFNGFPQSNSAEIFNSQFFFQASPLTGNLWFSEQNIKSNDKFYFNSDQNKILIGSKELAFVHFHVNFFIYASIYLQYRKVGLQKFTPKYSHTLIGSKSIKFKQRILKYLLGSSFLTNRKELVDALYSKRDKNGTPYIIEVLNHCLTSTTIG